MRCARAFVVVALLGCDEVASVGDAAAPDAVEARLLGPLPPAASAGPQRRSGISRSASSHTWRREDDEGGG